MKEETNLQITLNNNTLEFKINKMRIRDKFRFGLAILFNGYVKMNFTETEII